MARHTLLDLLGTDHVSEAAEQQLIMYCVQEQARPALGRCLEACGLPVFARQLAALEGDSAFLDVVRAAADAARTQDGLPVMALAAVQGIAAETDQMLTAADDLDAQTVSFHAARIVGWAHWAGNKFSTGILKASAEEVAYGEQLKVLMQALGTAGL